jgi:hypothetical protein
MTVILDREGDVFGGFTPLKWNSSRGWVFDETRESCLFTLRNQHNCSPRRFPLKPDNQRGAISCVQGCGPHFCDMSISNNCNENTKSFTTLGNWYVNDTGVDGNVLFAGSEHFKVEEIEVFEIL